MADRDIIEGIIDKVSPDKFVFTLKGRKDWYRVSKDLKDWPENFQAGINITFEHNESTSSYTDKNGEKKTGTTHWCNDHQFDADDLPSADDLDIYAAEEEQSDLMPPEAPPIGKYESKSQIDKIDFNIVYGMCYNKMMDRAMGLGEDSDWVFLELESEVPKLVTHREKVREMILGGK